MTLTLRSRLLTKNNCYKAGKKINPVGIVMHSTGANNPNLKRYVQPDDGKLGVNPNGNDWNRPKPDGQSKCPHAFIGKDKNGAVACYQTLPWDAECWGCGSGKNGSYNRNPVGHIQIEVCEDDLTDKEYYEKAFEQAELLCAYLCKKYKLKAAQIVSHKEAHTKGYASNHADPDHWMKKHSDSMAKFRKRVQEQLSNKLKVGDKVKVLNNTVYGTNKTFKTYFANYDVLQVSGDRVVIGKGDVVTAPVAIKNLEKVK